MKKCNFKLGRLLNLTNGSGGIYEIVDHVYKNGGYRIVSYVAAKTFAVGDRDLFNDLEDTKKEMEITKFASDIGVGPHFYDYCQIDNSICIIIEYLNNAITLTDYIKKGILTVETADKIKDLLDTMYDNGLIHEDLHGQNILFNYFNRPYVIDFGIAKIQSGPVPQNKRNYVIESGNLYLDVEKKEIIKIKYNFKTKKITKDKFNLTNVGFIP